MTHGQLTVRDARSEYFQRAGFGAEGNYDDAWVKLRLGPIPFAFPNTQARKLAVRFHDLHHVLTGYDTSWTGEGQIAGFELASGCAHHLVAWVLNAQAFALGLVIAPRKSFRAFLRGLRSENLFRSTIDDALLSLSVDQLRARLHLPTQPVPASLRDVLVFAGAALGSLAVGLLTLAVLLSPLVGLAALVAAIAG